MIERRAAGLALVVAFAFLPRLADAQGLVPKRSVGASVVQCPVVAQPESPTPAQRQEARRLSAQGREAAIAGDQGAAEEFFREAAGLDATDQDIAYRLARVHQELGHRQEAVREFCRYLALAPAAPDAAEVRARIAALSPVGAEGPPSAALGHFRAGLEHLDAGRLREAEQAFTSAIGEAPRWPAPHYNRGLVHATADRPARAVEDLRQYLALNPQAEDSAWVARHIAELRRRVPSPGGALLRGVLIPGLGQFYTRRPALGVLVLGATAAASYAAVQPKVETRRAQYTDIFGNVHEYTYEETTFPSLTTGIAVAAGVAVVGAIEAYIHARRGRVREPAAEPQREAAPPVSQRGARLGAPSLHLSPRMVGVSFDF